VRFAERLQLRVDVPRELFAAQVPSLILQPMVENAVKHGIANECREARSGLRPLALMVCSLSRIYNDGPALLRAGKRLTPEQDF